MKNLHSKNVPSAHDPCCRCGNKLLAMTCSIFNTDWICLNCSDKERQHPDYQRAKDEEIKAVKSGNYNYEGIGLPVDLQTIRIS